jgi:hypothetical protein
LSREILVDTPLGYWKLDEASGNFADSSGNSRTLTAAGSPTYRAGCWNPRSTDKFVYFDASGDGATRADTSGLTVPADVNWTFETLFISPVHHATDNYSLFTIDGTDETEAMNTQVLASLVGVTVERAQMKYFWEYSTGTDETGSAPVGRVPCTGPPVHLAWVKDGTANTVTFYINGILMDVVAYTNEPTGGSTATTYLHGGPAGTFQPCGMAHAALYSSALSQARIMAHARAAGLLAY